MSKSKVDTVLLFEMMRQGKTQKECAQFFGVSEANISKIKKKTKTVVNREIALFSAGAVLDLQINYLQDLAVQQQQLKDLLDTVYVMLNEDDGEKYWEARARLTKLIGSKGSLQNLLIGLHAELRKQQEFGFNIDKVMDDMKNIRKFQSVIMDTIRNVDPGTAKKIAAELARLKIIKSSLDFDIRPEPQGITSVNENIE